MANLSSRSCKRNWLANNLTSADTNNKKNICCIIMNLSGLGPKLQGQFLNPWNFPSDGNLLFVDFRSQDWVYANEVTHGGPPGSLRMWAGHAREIKHVGLRVSFEKIAINLTSMMGREARDWVQPSRQWFKQLCLHHKTPVKLWTFQFCWTSWLVIHTDALGGWHVLRTWVLSIWDPARPHPM